MSNVHSDSFTPLYTQVATAILEKIKRKEYVYGHRIPSETELCEAYDVSRITIRKAVDELEAAGHLVKKRGKGTFVSYPQIIDATSAGGSFTNSCLLIGAKPSTIVLSKSLESVSDRMIKRLPHLNKEDQVIKIVRLRLIDDVPAIYEVDYFVSSYRFLINSDLESNPIMDLIRAETGLVAKSFEDSFEVVSASTKIAEALNVSAQSGLLKVDQLVLSDSNEVIYFNTQYIVTDVYKYVLRHGG